MYIKVNQKKLNILLFAISIIFYCTIYWKIYSLIIFEIINLDLKIINVLDMIYIYIFIFLYLQLYLVHVDLGICYENF